MNTKKQNHEKFRKGVLSVRERRLREAEKKKMEAERAEKSAMKSLHDTFPPAILTILKRLKRIDPWSGVVELNPWDCALVCYFKLRQSGMEEVRIKTNMSHAWVEFKHTGSWYTFDPIAIKETAFGDPVQKSGKYNSDSPYGLVGNTYETAKEFYDAKEDKFELTMDMAKIEAMENYSLNTVLQMNYY